MGLRKPCGTLFCSGSSQDPTGQNCRSKPCCTLLLVGIFAEPNRENCRLSGTVRHSSDFTKRPGPVNVIEGVRQVHGQAANNSSTAEKNENQTPVQDQRCQSGLSARNSVVLSEGGFSKNYGADQQRLQISDLHFDKFPTPSTFACWKIRFKTEVCTFSQFPTEAMLWIKEVEMVESVDDLKSSCSVRGIRMPDFEVLDARIASALNRIIHNSHFK